MIPSENRLTVFDADTQETSYGICVFDGLPYIFDTHRKGTRYVATLELLTEVVEPIRVSRDRIRRFGRDARKAALLPIPYSACFFKANLHVYAFSGPVRGFDLAAIGATALQSERALMQRVTQLRSRVPAAIAQAQRGCIHPSFNVIPTNCTPSKRSSSRRCGRPASTTCSRFVERRDPISSTCGPSPRHELNCRKKSRRRSRPSRPPNVRASRRALGGKAGWAWAHRAPAARSTFLKEPASW